MSLRVKRSNPCPERSEGSLEIATGFALATTSSDCHDPAGSRNDKNQRFPGFFKNLLTTKQMYSILAAQFGVISSEYKLK